MKRNKFEGQGSSPDEQAVRQVLDKFQEQGLRDNSHEYLTLDMGGGNVKYIPKRAYIRYEGDRIELADYIEMVIGERDEGVGDDSS